MKLILTILNFFGLTTLKNQAAELKKVIDSTATELAEKELVYKKLVEEELCYKKLFDWKLKQNEILSFEDYCTNNGIDRSRLDKNWNDTFHSYYDKYNRKPYQSYKIINLCKHPDLLNSFLLSFSSFDWEKIEKYMASVNWCWSDKKTTPTISDLKDCVITLIPTDGFEEENNTISTGGFSVNLHYKDGEAICKITFEK